MVAESWMDVRMVGREYLANLRFLATYRIQTWALEEARRRLEIEGLLEDPEKK
jgi:ESSS subunit of NADH:ubiquinone oxidoreductase (complex I)